MATLRRKKAEPFSVFQRDPGPWPPILLNWMATLAIIMVFGLVMLFSASYTTGYLRFGDSFHYIKSQLLCTVLGLGMMFLFSYFDHRFLRRMVKLGYVVCLILLVLVLFSSPINGCRRWISFGGLTLQASEVAKFEMILLRQTSPPGPRRSNSARCPCASGSTTASWWSSSGPSCGWCLSSSCWCWSPTCRASC